MGYTITTPFTKYVNFTDPLPNLYDLINRFPNFSTIDGKRTITGYSDSTTSTITIINHNRKIVISIMDYKLENVAIYVNNRLYYMLNYKNNNLHGTQMVTLYGYKYIIHMNNGSFSKSYKFIGGILNYGTRLIKIEPFEELIYSLQKIDNESRNYLR